MNSMTPEKSKRQLVPDAPRKRKGQSYQYREKELNSVRRQLQFEGQQQRFFLAKSR